MFCFFEMFIELNVFNEPFEMQSHLAITLFDRTGTQDIGWNDFKNFAQRDNNIQVCF